MRGSKFFILREQAAKLAEHGQGVAQCLEGVEWGSAGFLSTMNIRQYVRDIHGVIWGDWQNWATYNGAELDLLLFKNGQRIGVECKRADAPVLTPSKRIAQHDLKLDRLYVVYPGERAYSLGKNVEVTPLAKFIGTK
jgi:hypothetical protein